MLVHILSVVASALVTLVLSNRYIAKYKKLAMTDSLTELENRRAYDKFMEHKFHKNTYLYMIDVDNLKKINDQCGHTAGDEALKKVAQILKEICRKRDGHAFRYGGDEFVMICELESEQQAMEMKESLVQMLQPIQVSVGYASNREEMWFQKADEMLYKDKNALRS